MVTVDLASFPAPHMAVDVAVLTISPAGQMCLLLVRRHGDKGGTWALPGRFVRERQRLSEAVAVTLEEKCGLAPADLLGRSPRQLHLFDDPERDDRGWVMSMAHLLALPHESLTPALAACSDLQLAPIVDDHVRVAFQRGLPYGQDAIVDYAVQEMRRLYATAPDPEGLISDREFTLAQLYEVHAAVMASDWQIDTFRRHMTALLDETGRRATGGVGRPAALFRTRQ